MTAEAIMTISAACVACVQLLKWSGLPDARGPLAVLGLSLVGTVFWTWSHGALTQTAAFDYFSGWIAVATSSAGVFGFTRSGPAAVTATKTPPAAPGAGASVTVKQPDETISEKAFRESAETGGRG